MLDYLQFASRAVDKAVALGIVARLAQMVDSSAPLSEDALPLPKCKDRDDQKFLEFARAVDADWLVSKDRALLKLTRRTERDFRFRIAQLVPLVSACGLESAAPVPA